MKPTVFTPAQLELLELMSFVSSDRALAELKQAISNHFASQAQSEIDRLWDTGELNEAKVESFRHLHERTPYRK